MTHTQVGGGWNGVGWVGVYSVTAGKQYRRAEMRLQAQRAGR